MIENPSAMEGSFASGRRPGIGHCGDLAGILTMAANGNTPLKERPPSVVQGNLVAGARNFFCYNLGSVVGFAPGNDVKNPHQLAA